jgi:hypothetical protein
MRVTPRWTVMVGLAVATIVLAAGSLSGASAAQGVAEDGTGSPAAPVRSDLQTEVLAPGRTPSEERDLHIGPRPRFVEPAATTTEHTRLGLSAWIAQGAPVERHENPGGVAIGFTVAWPPPRAESRAAPRP